MTPAKRKSAERLAERDVARILKVPPSLVLGIDASGDLATLRRLRLERDLSYAQLGALIGLRRQTIFRLLNEADARPNDRTRYKIEKFLRTEVQ